MTKLLKNSDVTVHGKKRRKELKAKLKIEQLFLKIQILDPDPDPVKQTTASK